MAGLWDMLLAKTFGGGQAVNALLQPEMLETARRDDAAALKPLLNKYGPGAAAEIGSKLQATSPELRRQGAMDIAGLEKMNRTGALASARVTRSDVPYAAETRTDSRGFQSLFETARMSPESKAYIEAQESARKLDQARMTGLGVTERLNRERAEREAIKNRVTNRRDYQTAVQGNDAIGYGLNGVQRLMQLEATLDDPNASALDVLNAAVFLTQIIEEGLATRNDDRMAVKQGAQPGVQDLANEMNQFLSGNYDLGTARANIMRSARNMLKPMIAGTQDAISYWDQVATDTPGVQSGDIARILGIDQAVFEKMEEINIPAL